MRIEDRESHRPASFPAILNPSPSILKFPASRAGILVLLITLAVWLPTLRNDFVDWDDLNMIVTNPRFNPPTWASTGWYWTHPAWNLYQPMTTTVWALLARLGWVDVPDQFGGHMNPAVFHFASVLLQAAAAFLLFQILRRAVIDPWAAAIGALLFAVHPIQVEAVAFAGAMNNVLAGALAMLAVWQYLILTDQAKSLSFASRFIRWTIASVALLLAMLAKPSAVVAAPIALLLDLGINRPSLRAAIRSILPWVLLELPCVVLTRLMQHGSDAARSPAWFRPIIAGDSTLFYLRKIFWPAQLAIDYGRTPEFVRTNHLSWLTLLAPLALLMIAWSSARRAQLLASAAAIFLIGLLPNSGLMPFDYQLVSTVADRYIYFGMIGIALAAAAMIQSCPALRYAGVAILVWLTICTEIQITTWRNGETLFRHALEVNPNSWMSTGNLAEVIADRSPDQAISLCQKAINLRRDRPDVWNTLGSILMTKGDRPRAIVAFQTAHRLAPANPIFASNSAVAQW